MEKSTVEEHFTNIKIIGFILILNLISPKFNK